MDRLCSRCQQVKAPEEFYGQRRTWCKSCFREYASKRYLVLHPPKVPIPSGFKRCPRCRKILLLEHFRLRASGTPYAYCHSCWRIKSEETRKSHVEHLRGPLGSKWAEWRTTGVRRCPRCKKDKPVASFYTLKNGSLGGHCRRCYYEAHRRWLKSEAGKASIRKYSASPARRLKNHARRFTQSAVALGILTKQSCEVTGCPSPSEAHHEDYTKPLEVRWLCREHHRARHDAMKSPLD